MDSNVLKAPLRERFFAPNICHPRLPWETPRG
jgi:hypothetical protein